jgi:hypothetical protein
MVVHANGEEKEGVEWACRNGVEVDGSKEEEWMIGVSLERNRCSKLTTTSAVSSCLVGSVWGRQQSQAQRA